MRRKIVVVGSCNTDLTMKMSDLPEPGNTVIGCQYYKSPGGKGANQAVAAARAGAEVAFIAKLGDDEYSKDAIRNFRAEGILTDDLMIDQSSHTGIAMIWVDGKGENSIAVASGANARIRPSEIMEKRDIIASGAILLLQLEIPLDSVYAAVEEAYSNGIKIILNPAPAFEIEHEILKKLDVITPNIHEAETLTGVKINTEADIKNAAQVLMDRGVSNVVITHGSNGVYVLNENGYRHFPACKVNVTDTTAAGDTLNGSLAAFMAEGFDIYKAVEYANAAAALSVTKMGAQVSAPYRSEIMNYLRTINDAR
ncbi:MAG: ribokinase [Bacteroidota bacterium]